MSNDTTEFVDDVCRQLEDDGYTVHIGTGTDGPGFSVKHWFTWIKPGMSDVEVGPTCDTALAAWASALAHRIANSEIALYFEPTPHWGAASQDKPSCSAAECPSPEAPAACKLLPM